jgi:hypothetical protein
MVRSFLGNWLFAFWAGGDPACLGKTFYIAYRAPSIPYWRDIRGVLALQQAEYALRECHDMRVVRSNRN